MVACIQNWTEKKKNLENLLSRSLLQFYIAYLWTDSTLPLHLFSSSLECCRTESAHAGGQQGIKPLSQFFVFSSALTYHFCSLPVQQQRDAQKQGGVKIDYLFSEASCTDFCADPSYAALEQSSGGGNHQGSCERCITFWFFTLGMWFTKYCNIL